MQFNNITSLARIIILDGIRRHALLGLLLLSLFSEIMGLFFMDFISHDVGRASSDFLFSIMWLAGLLFLFFHAVQVISWDEERGVIYSILSRPLSRASYVIGVFSGLSVLLILLHAILGIVALSTLIWIQSMLDPTYFQTLSLPHFLLSWCGLVIAQLVVLSVVMLFSGLVRGGFPVLLLSVAYYAICTALPTVRESLYQNAATTDTNGVAALLLQILTAFFPDLTDLDYKNSVLIETLTTSYSNIAAHFLIASFYCVIMIACACFAYNRRDLQ